MTPFGTIISSSADKESKSKVNVKNDIMSDLAKNEDRSEKITNMLHIKSRFHTSPLFIYNRNFSQQYLIKVLASHVCCQLCRIGSRSYSPTKTGLVSLESRQVHHLSETARPRTDQKTFLTPETRKRIVMMSKGPFINTTIEARGSTPESTQTSVRIPPWVMRTTVTMTIQRGLFQTVRSIDQRKEIWWGAALRTQG